MATVVYGDFEWDESKAVANLAKHGVAFEEASTVFSDPCYILRVDETHPDRFFAIGMGGLARLLMVDPRRAWAAHPSRACPATPRPMRPRYMNDDASNREPSAESLEEIPEVDFSRGIQPHRYAQLRAGYEYAVFLEPELWRHFGSADAVKAALRALVAASRHVRATG